MMVKSSPCMRTARLWQRKPCHSSCGTSLWPMLWVPSICHCTEENSLKPNKEVAQQRHAPSSCAIACKYVFRTKPETPWLSEKPYPKDCILLGASLNEHNSSCMEIFLNSCAGSLRGRRSGLSQRNGLTHVKLETNLRHCACA